MNIPKIDLSTLRLPNMDELAMVDWSVEGMSAWSLPARIAVAVSVFILSFLISFYAFTSDQINTLEQAQKKEIILKATLKTKQAKITSLLTHEKQVEQLNDSFTRMMQKISDNIDMSYVLNEIHKLESDSPLKIDFFKPHRAIKQVLYSEIPISLRVTGTYKEISMFINHLLSLSPIVTMHDISIISVQNSINAQDSNGLLTTDMIIKVYERTKDESGQDG